MSQIQCGTLEKVTEKNDDKIEFQGYVSLGRRLDGVLYLAAHEKRSTNPDSPEFRVLYAHQRRGAPKPLGTGWKRKSKDGKTEFLNLNLDDPDWSGELNLSAFKGAKGWEVVWSRPRGARVQGEAQAAVA